MNEFPDDPGQQSGAGGQAEPVFTATRRTRTRGPGRGPLLGSIAAIVVIGGAVAWWIRGGDADVQPPPPEPAAAVAADTAPPQMEPEVEAPPADTTPPPPPPVRLAFEVEPAGVTITVDDSLTADTAEGIELPAGTYRVHAEAAGYIAMDTVVELTSDMTLGVALRLATGTVEVRANLAGRVLVGGRDRGAAPISGLRLRPGTYTVRFVPEGADALAAEQRVTVRAGQASRAAFEVTDALISVGVRSPRWASVYSGDNRLGDTPLIQHRVPARVHTLRVARDGYVEQERLVRLSPGQNFQWVDVVLEAEGG
jgi:hypothetical protein